MQVNPDGPPFDRLRASGSCADGTVVKWHGADVGNALTPTLSRREREFAGAGAGGDAGLPFDRLRANGMEGLGASGDGLKAAGVAPVTFVLSTDDVDRHGDVVSADGWRLEAYLRNPVLLWAHDYRHPAIGRAISVWTEPHRLLAKMEFAPGAFAQEVAALYACGFQWGVSVGFRPIRWEERRDARTGAFLGLRYLEQELLEVSAVPVPANREALRREAEGDALTHSTGSGQAPTLSRGEGELPLGEMGIAAYTVAVGALLAELEGARVSK